MDAHERMKRKLWAEHLARLKAKDGQQPQQTEPKPTRYERVKADPVAYRELLDRQAANKRRRRATDPEFRAKLNRKRKEARARRTPEQVEADKAKARARYIAKRIAEGKSYTPREVLATLTPEERKQRHRESLARSKQRTAERLQADPAAAEEAKRQRREHRRYRIEHEPGYLEKERERQRRRYDRIRHDPELLEKERARRRALYAAKKARVLESKQAENGA